jgi:hypothetical protein
VLKEEELERIMETVKNKAANKHLFNEILK